MSSIRNIGLGIAAAAFLAAGAASFAADEPAKGNDGKVPPAASEHEGQHAQRMEHMQKMHEKKHGEHQKRHGGEHNKQKPADGQKQGTEHDHS